MRGPGSMISRCRASSSVMSALRRGCCGVVAVLAVQLLELVPGRLLVREVDAPLDVDQRAGVAAALDLVADLERPSLGALVVVDADLEARGLALDAPLGVLERLDGQLGRAVRRELGLPLRVAGDRQRRPAVSGAMQNSSGLLPSRAMPMPGWMR